MKRLLLIVGLACGAGIAFAADAVKLEANATLHFEFPNLPDTLMNLTRLEKQPAILTAQLPANYTRGGKFPLFVFLTGSEGGRGTSVGVARGVAGSNDFICVNLPLFKRRVDPLEMLGGVIVSVEDAPVLCSSYRVMLQKLFDTVPNIAPERSTIGGFSNGAHTTGVLLAAQDDFVLKHFRQFFLIEGGAGPLFANVLQKKSLNRTRLLLMRGDRATGFAHDLMERLAVLLEDGAKLQKLDFTSVIMRGYGHEMPPDYMKQVGQWARGKKTGEASAK